MRKDLNSIIECYSCGLFVKKEAKSGINQRCPRCNSKLEIHKKHSNDSLYYAISSLLLFGILNIYPIITLNINENELKATLIGTVSILLEQNFFFVALIVFFTIILAPILNSLIIIFAFIQAKTKIKLFTKTLLHDSFHFFKHWGFIEVFIVSIIVTYIKLIGMVSSTKFDIGFYVMLAYVFCFYMSNKKFEGKSVFGE
ncbi:MAG: paraquat-inducible protein A [Arcobacter sp.]|jgi:paraquat-inducible protein A|uniref:paraquat-inducible protein A n=1 Tax=unclassified Arcobacter TaxID=2593671 RepID=UPI0002295E87|nr:MULTISPECIES: paraquat-inducible protein A [unclassified Arcobacter]MDY3200803.1 paraquat-inducible protein A [Arcobacter sp.]BAK73910.1 paraquat-inducible protein A [Arcobacter sp. L]